MYFVTLNVAYFTLLFISYFSVMRYRRRNENEQWRRILQSPLTMPVSVLAPAFNEEVTIAGSVRSLLMLEYREFEAVVINDGSSDRTLETLTREFALEQIPFDLTYAVPSEEVRGVYRSSEYPQLVVVDKVNGGKADALNAGINVSPYPLVCAIDADSFIEGGALLRVTKPFLERPEETVAVGGIVRVVNGCSIEAGRVTRVGLANRWLPLIQTAEYLRAFLFGRSGWSAMNSMLIISGAFGVFRKDVVKDVGGFLRGTVGEDMELVVRMHHHLRANGVRHRMHFLPDPVCWTEVPESVRVLGRQRNRWQRGLMDSLLRHSRMMLNPRYGVVGLIAFPYFVFLEMLAPLVELLGWVVIPVAFGFGAIDWIFFGLFLAVALLLGAVLSTSSVLLEELTFRRYPATTDLLKLFAAGIIENFGYRQLTTWWRAKGIWDFLRGSDTWGKMERTGFSK